MQKACKKQPASNFLNVARINIYDLRRPETYCDKLMTATGDILNSRHKERHQIEVVVRHDARQCSLDHFRNTTANLLPSHSGGRAQTAFGHYRKLCRATEAVGQ